jgi:hypothetical protein
MRRGERNWSHPDGCRVDVGQADLEGDPARAYPAGEKHGRPQLVGERRRDAAEEVPLGALQTTTDSNQIPRAVTVSNRRA